MAYAPELLDLLEELPRIDWEGELYRFTVAKRPPHAENTAGARWNPPDVPAIYTALDRETLRAEFAHALNSWSPRPDPGRFLIHRIRVSLAGVADLRPSEVLGRLSLNASTIGSEDPPLARRWEAPPTGWKSEACSSPPPGGWMVRTS